MKRGRPARSCSQKNEINASQKSQINASQRSQKRASQKSQLDVDVSQTRLDHFVAPDVNIDEHVNNCVRYFICNAGHHGLIRKSDMQKKVLSNTQRQFDQIIARATEVLKNVYGFNLVTCDNQSSAGKAYILSNAMPNLEASDNQNKAEKILLLLILSHLFMSNGPVNEASLWSFLTSLNIDIERRHPLFGMVKDYVTNVLVKQKYLAVNADAVSKKTTYTWGLRAEKEISKHEVLRFVSKIYGDRQPTSWETHYDIANKQDFKNNKIVENERMDIGNDSD